MSDSDNLVAYVRVFFSLFLFFVLFCFFVLIFGFLKKGGCCFCWLLVGMRGGFGERLLLDLAKVLQLHL